MLSSQMLVSSAPSIASSTAAVARSSEAVDRSRKLLQKPVHRSGLGRPDLPSNWLDLARSGMQH
jgi:hypothetical protein